jgi:hypothetical protein
MFACARQMAVSQGLTPCSDSFPCLARLISANPVVQTNSRNESLMDLPTGAAPYVARLRFQAHASIDIELEPRAAAQPGRLRILHDAISI